MPRGWDRPLYVQPFDHRGSFLVAWHVGKATREDTAARIARRYREFVDLFEEH
jgi:hypothetical protein